MNKVDIIICAHGTYEIIYTCAMLALNAFPESRVFIFRTSPNADDNLSPSDLARRQELISRGAIMEYNSNPLVGDRGALTINLIWDTYLKKYACGNYTLHLYQDCWIVNPSQLRKNISKTIDDKKDGMYNYSICRDTFCYGTVAMFLKDEKMYYYVNDSVLGVVPCSTEFRMYDYLKKFNIHTNTPEKAISQYGYNYFFGLCHLHDKSSLKHYLDLYNLDNPSKKIEVDWDKIPEYTSIHERERGHRLDHLESFSCIEEFPTGLDDMSGQQRNADLSPTDADGWKKIIKNDLGYFAVKSSGETKKIEFATERTR